MNYTDRMFHLKEHLTAQRAYTRAVARGGVCELLRPYTVRAPVIPAQRRRSVQRERIGA